MGDMFSPRTRRCFFLTCVSAWRGPVFSAYAEVFLLQILLIRLKPSFLRVRGGVSNRVTSPQDPRWFSPRTRRCFRNPEIFDNYMKVFSAYAEVFPLTDLPTRNFGCFLRVRGGVS